MHTRQRTYPKTSQLPRITQFWSNFKQKFHPFSNEKYIPGKSITRNRIYPENNMPGTQHVPGKAHTRRKYRSKNSPTAMIFHNSNHKTGEGILGKGTYDLILVLPPNFQLQAFKSNYEINHVSCMQSHFQSIPFFFFFFFKTSKFTKGWFNWWRRKTKN